MSRNNIPPKSSTPNKRVGASVVVDGQPLGVVNQFPYGAPGVVNPYGPQGYGPFNPGFPGGQGIGIPNPCGCPPPFFPPVPFFPGIFFDDRVEQFPIIEDEFDVALTAGVAPQTIPANSTAALLLTSAVTSTGGARISGSSIILPVEGVYTLSVNVTASRPVTSAGGIVQFILNGGISGSGNIAFGDLAIGTTQVFSDTVTVRTNGVHTAVSILVNNAGGPLQILGGTISIQLNNRFGPFF